MKDDIIKGSIRNFEKYFLEIEKKETLIVVKLEKTQKRKELAKQFQSVKDELDLKSLKELHTHLKKKNLYTHSEEALRRLLKEK